MKSAGTDVNQRKLIDKLASPPQFGPLLGLVTTTYEFQPEFFETDFLPAVLNLGAWDNHSWTSRIEIEKHLAHMEAAAVFLDASRYRNRPRSLRVRIMPVAFGAGRSLHAKVVVLIYERAVRLIVGSSNLTTQGYRENREAAVVLTVTEKDKKLAPLISSALSALPQVLDRWWRPEHERLIQIASELLTDRITTSSEESAWFAWGGLTTPLWEQFVTRWPLTEKVSMITIVSPFWSEDEKHTELETMLSALRNRGCLESEVNVRLLAEATFDAKDGYRPTLPATFGKFDFRKFGVRASAQAVDPGVSEEEVGIEGFVRSRSLHAKVILLEGAKNSLSYVGSANFTKRGWGFLDSNNRANVEAGIIMLQENAGIKGIDNLVPKGIGPVVELKGDVEPQLAPPEPAPKENPFPFFVKDILLTPASDDKERLELLVLLEPGMVKGSWSVSLPEKAPEYPESYILQFCGANEAVDFQRVALDETNLNTILREQEVVVRWWESDEGQLFPVNVSMEARHTLPISPESGRFNEQHLILYYQGRIAWEDLFPEPKEYPPQGPLPSNPEESNGEVDTSRIQSYQIREFIEALRGIADDIKAASQSTESAMRLSLLGPVSPIALARAVVSAVGNGQRSPVAAGFQLVEIRACIVAAIKYECPAKRKEKWLEFIQEALAILDRLLSELKEKFPDDFGQGGGFSVYETKVRNHYGR